MSLFLGLLWTTVAIATYGFISLQSIAGHSEVQYGAKNFSWPRLPIRRVLARHVISILEDKNIDQKTAQALWEASLLYDVDPAVVLAVIKAESGFRIKARSEKGAMGLMQIMPDTGNWIAEKMGENINRRHIHQALADPVRNIRYGIFYLSYLRKMFGNNFVQVMVAYNAGPLAAMRLGSRGRIVSKNIQNYVQQVRREVAGYRQICFSL